MHQSDIPQNKSGSRRLIPVAKQPRKKWCIPRLDAHARLQEQKREEERIQALCEGTTPQGREILRKIIYGAEVRLEDDNTDVWQTIAWVEGQLRRFDVLREEFLILISRFGGFDYIKLCEVPVRDLAILLLLKLRLELVAQKNQ